MTPSTPGAGEGMGANPRDALAAKYFPREWARVATALGKSKQRQRLRQQAEAQQFLEQLRVNGANCAPFNLYFFSYHRAPAT